MQITAELLSSVASRGADPKNIQSIIIALNQFGAKLGLNQPHRFVQYGAQIAHESGGFKHDVEVWGPTPAQERYDTRTDLGNSPEKDGDGFKYRGRTGIQLTGKSNYQQFYDWCVRKGFAPPNFVEDPDLVNNDPWEGLVPLWYWDTRHLNRYADTGNNEMITKRINGGLNGYGDRLERYSKLGLAMLGYPYNDAGLRAFQAVAKGNGTYDGDIDGDDGPKTRSAIHQALVKLGTMPVAETKPAPVTEHVPVVPQGAEKVNMGRFWGLVSAAGTALVALVPTDPYIRAALVGVSIVGVVVLLWKAELIAGRVKAAVKAFGLDGDH